VAYAKNRARSQLKQFARRIEAELGSKSERVP
jgi:hypothetical protein